MAEAGRGIEVEITDIVTERFAISDQFRVFHLMVCFCGLSSLGLGLGFGEVQRHENEGLGGGLREGKKGNGCGAVQVNGIGGV